MRLMRLLVSASLLIASSACSAPEPLTELRVERIAIPAPLLSCDNEPPAPKQGATWAEFFGWIVDLRAAGDDCRAKVEAIGALQR